MRYCTSSHSFPRLGLPLLLAAFLLIHAWTPASGEGVPCPFRYKGEVSLPSGEALVGPHRIGDVSDDARNTLVAYKNGQVNLYFTYPLQTIRKLGKLEGVRLVALSRNAKWAVAVGDKYIKAWPLEGDYPEPDPLPFETAGVDAIDISDHGVAAIAGLGHSMVYSFVKTEALNPLTGIHCLSARVRGDHAVMGTRDGRAILLDMKTGALLKDFRLGIDPVECADLSSGPTIVAAGNAKQRKVMVFSVETGETLHTLTAEGIDFFPDRPVIRDCSVSPDGLFVAVSYKKKFLLHDLTFNNLAGFASLSEDTSGRIRLVGERKSLFCKNTLSFREYKPGRYNCLTDEPTLSLVAASTVAEGVRSLAYAPDSDNFFLFLLNGSFVKVSPPDSKLGPLGTVPVNGAPRMSPSGKRFALGFERAIWFYSGSKSKPVIIDLVEGWDEFDIVEETRLLVQFGKQVTFYDSRGKVVVSAELSFVPAHASVFGGAGYFVDNAGNWALVSLANAAQTTGKLELGEGRLLGLSRSGPVVQRGIEVSWFRPGEAEAVFTAPLAREVTGIDVSPDGKWVAWCSPMGLFVRDIEKGDRWQLAEASNLPNPVFNKTARRLYAWSNGGIATFMR